MGRLWGFALGIWLLGGLTGCAGTTARHCPGQFAGQPTGQSMEQSAGRLTGQSMEQSAGQFRGQSAEQSAEESAEESTGQQPTGQSTGQSIGEPKKNQAQGREDWMAGMEAENEAKRRKQAEENPEKAPGEGPEEDAGNNPGETAAESPLAGSIHLAGSSSMEKYADALAESFMEKHPDVTVTVQFTGSGAGIEAVASGMADIGNSSRYLTDAEKARGVQENIVAIDGIAVCVDSANPVTNVTKQQLADLYTGTVTNWSALGGDDMPVVVVGREAGSGTREAFEAFLGVNGQCTYANELDSTGAVLARVAATPGAIGYVSFDAVSAWTKGEKTGEEKGQESYESRQLKIGLLSLDGVVPSVENVEEGTYPLCHPFVMATRGEIAAQSDLLQAWLRYVYSDEGREIAQKLGLTVRESDASAGAHELTGDCEGD